MKKVIFEIISVIGLCCALFADDKLDTDVAEFLNQGNYILKKNGSEKTFIPKHIISRIETDTDEFSYTFIDKEFDYETESFKISKTVIYLDANKNIVIEKQ